MSDTEILRRVAMLMRERAEAATPGPWSYVGEQNNAGIRCDAPQCGGPWPVVDRELQPNDGDHIASWHPAVALAVADLLDDGATYLAFMAREHPNEPRGEYGQYFLAVANAYLREMEG